MKDIRNMVRKEIEKIWPQTQKTLSKLNKDAAKLMKKTEENLVATYVKTRKTTETLILKAQREKLFYELGRLVAPLLTSDQLKNKNVLRISSEIRRLNKKLRAGR